MDYFLGLLSWSSVFLIFPVLFHKYLKVKMGISEQCAAITSIVLIFGLYAYGAYYGVSIDDLGAMASETLKNAAGLIGLVYTARVIFVKMSERLAQA